MNTKLLVCTHKNITIPLINGLDEYMLIQCGPISDPDYGFTRADSLNDMGDLNQYLSLLQAYHWAWKSLTCDNIGIIQYRRLLFHKNKLLTKEIVEPLLKNYDFLVPRCLPTTMPIQMKYLLYTSVVTFDLLFDILDQDYPEYLPTYYTVMSEKKLINFNMMVTTKENFDSYCTWLFDILFKFIDLLQQKPYSSYTPPNSFVCSYVAEILFNVYLYYHNFSFCSLKVKVYAPDAFNPK
ncbi:MAG: DUF4422 domain-containing protein [bacterium]|nr:DUF4422 domain-containing protein [bacterium]